MHTVCKPFSALTAEDLEGWRRVQALTPHPRPQLTVSYCAAVESVMGGVEVALVRDRRAAVVAVLPFQRGHDGVAQAPAMDLNDGDGVLALPGIAADPTSILDACELQGWRWAHAPVGSPIVADLHQAMNESAVVDLPSGVEDYMAQHTARTGTSIFSQTARKARKLAREVGPLRLDHTVASVEAAEALMSLKSRQLRARGEHDPLGGVAWPGRLLGHLLTRPDPEGDLTTVLSTLHAGEHLMAMHWSLRTGAHLLSCIPAHDPDAARWSPGRILTLDLLRHAAATGCTRVELGLGLDQTKRSLMTQTVPLGAGLLHDDPTLHRRQLRAQLRSASAELLLETRAGQALRRTLLHARQRNADRRGPHRGDPRPARSAQGE